MTMPDAACRLLPFAVADGPHNMAADETLMESAAASVASLRFYGWLEATLSLGYFQAEKLRLCDPRLAGLPFVRRPSGGATLIHHHELTYCLALPVGTPWQTGESWLCRMHGLIAAALDELGVPAVPQAAGTEPPFAGLLCFQHFTAGDLLIGSAKIVGSAQRRQRGALMQHGSILLAQSPYAPDLPGILELSRHELKAAEICEAVQRVFARTTGWPLVPSEWKPWESNRVHDLATTKYSQARWNQKR